MSGLAGKMITLNARWLDRLSKENFMATLTKAARRKLGRTGMEVFPLNLGGNVFGWTADREASFAVLDAYLEAGGNFIDTADAYNRWVPGHAGGESEALIGEWLKARNCVGV